jgi:hypothetical protein
LKVIATNSVIDQQKIKDANDIIDKLKSFKDPQMYYLERLMAMIQRPEMKSQLGLIRIAHEGRFTLECFYEKPTMTITASRKL